MNEADELRKDMAQLFNRSSNVNPPSRSATITDAMELIHTYCKQQVAIEAAKYCDDGHYHDDERDIAMLPSERLAELKEKE